MDQIIAEGLVTSSGVTEKASYLVYDKVIMREGSNGIKSYYIHNGHGDVTELRDQQSNIQIQYEYDLWGNVLSEVRNVTNVENIFMYSGELWDPNAKLQYLRARWYDPSIGRFITKDTYEGELTNPLSMNLYTYVTNNPLKYIDPSGHSYCYSESQCKALNEKLGLTKNNDSSSSYKRVDEMTYGELMDALMDPNVPNEDKSQIIIYIGAHYIFGAGIVGETKAVGSAAKAANVAKGTGNIPK